MRLGRVFVRAVHYIADLDRCGEGGQGHAVAFCSMLIVSVGGSHGGRWCCEDEDEDVAMGFVVVDVT